MRKWILLAAMTVAAFSMASLGVNRAEALPVANPACLGAAADEMNLARDADYVCRRVWRCGPYGHCGWRRSCWWSDPGYGYYDYGYRGYRYRGWGWRHRGWHHGGWHHHHHH